jgi:hypothetical protein
MHTICKSGLRRLRCCMNAYDMHTFNLLGVLLEIFLLPLLIFLLLLAFAFFLDMWGHFSVMFLRNFWRGRLTVDGRYGMAGWAGWFVFKFFVLSAGSLDGTSFLPASLHLPARIL